MRTSLRCLVATLFCSCGAALALVAVTPRHVPPRLAIERPLTPREVAEALVAQTVTITLNGVNDTTIGTATITMPVLLGDTNGDRVVNSGDATETRGRAGQTVSATNFRSDVNTDGFLNSGDTIIVRNSSGTAVDTQP